MNLDFPRNHLRFISESQLVGPIGMDKRSVLSLCFFTYPPYPRDESWFCLSFRKRNTDLALPFSAENDRCAPKNSHILRDETCIQRLIWRFAPQIVGSSLEGYRYRSVLIIDPLSITVIGVRKGRDGITQGIVPHAGLGNLRASHWLKVHEHLPGSSLEALFFLVAAWPVSVRGRVLSSGVNSVFRECRAHRVFVVSYPFHGSITGCFPLKTQGISLRFSIPLAGARGSKTCRTNKHEVESQLWNPLPFFILHSEVFKYTTARSLGFYASIFVGRNS